MSHKGYNVKKAEQTEMRMISTRPLFEKNIFILHFSSPFASFDVKAEKRLIQHLPCRPRQYSTLSTQEVFIWTVAPLKAFQTKIQFRHPTTQDIVLKMCQLECRL